MERNEMPEIRVTPAMIEAGLEELREHRLGGDWSSVLESVFRTMAYASLEASETSEDK